ncbi:MAG: hypothetical protein IT267_03740 [Saprospiraceae bacterium]|nr:hypothetical protein [Saprospiraceae bacterium]
MKNVIYFLSLTITLLFSCCKEDDPCPTCFDNIVRCKVNGKDWVSNCVSNDPLFGCKAVTTYYYVQDGCGLNLSATNDILNTGVSINQHSSRGGAKLGLNEISYLEFRFRNHSLIGNCTRLDSINFNYSNYLIIDQIDTINNLLEGRFGFQNYNLCGDTVTVTDGYFKTKYIY